MNLPILPESGGFSDRNCARLLPSPSTLMTNWHRISFYAFLSK
jgi:hypothetical protein